MNRLEKLDSIEVPVQHNWYLYIFYNLIKG